MDPDGQAGLSNSRVRQSGASSTTLESPVLIRRTTIAELQPIKVEILELAGTGAFSNAVIEVSRDQIEQNID